MPAPSAIITVIREWLAKADNDLLTATHSRKLGAACPTETVGFHSQQCVEKYLKAVLVFRGTPFPKTHNIHELQTLLPARLRPALDRVLQDRLTRYATVIRYPGHGAAILLPEARRAVAVARRVRREVRRHLPPASLRRARN